MHTPGNKFRPFVLLSKAAYFSFFVLTKPTWLAAWGGVAGYCTVIFFLSAQSHLQVPGAFPYGDKLVHLGLYAGLGWLWVRAVKTQWPGWEPLPTLLVTLLFTAGYGLSDEWHQAHVPGRFADLRDVLADAVGGVLGGWSYLLWRKYTKSEKSRGQRR